MGDHHDYSFGLSKDDQLCSGVGHIKDLDFSMIEEDNWRRAEEVSWDIVSRIHPTTDVQYRRMTVIEYIRRLVKSSLGIEVFAYGSVPLKTYLPDGDIDLTVISNPIVEDESASDVLSVLKREEQNPHAPFNLKDVQFIDAEVKLIKCIMQNIVVDISFNQVGGLGTLCFLEQVDRLVGKSHLFKHSVILIKAWCYYESRILGAHHGLISTYALETLILYIFHTFHTTLNGPLTVLYRFLDYFSKFDWEKYCVCLSGPVPLSSFSDGLVELPKVGGSECLLDDEFLKNCVGMFSLPSWKSGENARAFPQKHLNIIDPLKENNNLGRSVNRGNFYRIRSAFKYGAHKLGIILMLSSEKISDELNKFFANTLDRHGSNYWNDVLQNAAETSRCTSSDSPSVASLSRSDASSDDGAFFLRPAQAACDDGRENFFAVRLTEKEGEENPSPILPRSTHSAPRTVSEGTGSAQDEGDPDGLSATCRNPQRIKTLLDLTGDYDGHFRSMAYGQYCHFHALPTAPLLPPHHHHHHHHHHHNHNPVITFSPSKLHWRTGSKLMRFKPNGCSQQMRINGVLQPQFYCIKPPAPFDVAFNFKKNNNRGTGTYIPNLSYLSGRIRVPMENGWNQHPNKAHGVPRGRPDDGTIGATPPHRVNLAENCHKFADVEEYPCLGNGKLTFERLCRSHQSVWGSVNTCAFSDPSSHRNDHGPMMGLLPQLDDSLPAMVGPSDFDVSCHQASAPPSLSTSMASCSDSLIENEQERIEQKPYQLKDEMDFPPLCAKS